MVSQPKWAKNPIDRFILARLDKEKIAPSPEAAKTTLIRRVTLDLTGLPPTPEEVDDFLADKRPDAYERLVDRLLASPHYGEQRARALARPRPLRRLRRLREGPGPPLRLALAQLGHRRRSTSDMPFDQFTIEQLAGDLLPNATTEQLVATGFHRNTLTNREGGVDREESRFEQLVDRTNTVGTVWLGLTVGCAQCHDHKYDPITQSEYYQLFAFFDQRRGDDIDAPLAGEIGPWMRARPAIPRRPRAPGEGLRRRSAAGRVGSDMRKAIDEPGEDMEWDFAVANGRPMFDRVEEVVRTPKDKRTAARQRAPDLLVRQQHPARSRTMSAIARKCKHSRTAPAPGTRSTPARPSSPRPPSCRELPRSAETHIAVKGDYREHGVEVEPGVPGCPAAACRPTRRATVSTSRAGWSPATTRSPPASP